MAALISRGDRRQRQLRVQRRSFFPRKLDFFSSRRKLFHFLLISLAVVAILPPLYLHFTLRRFRQMQLRKCSWMSSPLLVCAHGGDSTKAFPNTVERANCKNCLVWAKSDSLARELIRLSKDTMVGYIVMIDPSTGNRMRPLRLKGAGVVGVYLPLIDEKLVKLLHGRNKKVYAWTVDEEEWMQKMLVERVDAVVTSNPSLLQQVMQDVKKQCFVEGFSLAS